MNPVLMLTHNNLELTKLASASVMAQDIRVDLLAVDNGSTDGTQNWLPDNSVARSEYNFNCWRNQDNIGVSAAWNWGLNYYFQIPFLNGSNDHVLVINNDVILPPWFYRQLLEYDKPFISGVSVDKMEQIAEPAPFGSIHPHPDFSAFLIKREVWEKVGPFDEAMKHYASDNDFHVRAHKAGIPLWKANVPFYHERSSTLRLASPEERAEIEAQANRDRAVFQQKYGVMPWGDGYDELFR